MSGSRRQRDSLAPTLFPFLAVLLCTMGALVLILMLVVAVAQATAKEAGEETRLRVEETEATLELAALAYEKQLNQGRLQLEKKRLALQHLEDHITELSERLSELEKTAALADEQADDQEDDGSSHQEALDELEKQLAEAKEELKTKLDDLKGDKPIFAIIPYEGTSGTHRRPIYLECTSEGVVIQPEGVRLSMSDLSPPYGPGNPLDAALRTIRQAYRPETESLTSNAYPLLVVRPSGIKSYAMARAAMRGWDDQFGYELIGESLELTFPKSTPGLKDKLASALETARQRQAALVMAMPRKYQRTNTERLTTSPDGVGGSYSSGDGLATAPPGEAGSGDPGGFAFDQTSSPGADAAKAGHATSDRLQGFASDDGLASNGGNPPAGSQDGLHGPRGDSELSLGGAKAEEDASLWGAETQGVGAARGDRLNPSGSGASFDSQLAMGGASGSPSDVSTGASSGTSSGATSGTSSGGGGSEMNLSGEQVALPSLDGATASSDQSASAGQSPASGGRQASSANAPGSSAGGSTDGSTASAASPMSASAAGRRESAEPVARTSGRNWAWSQGPPTQTPVVRSIRMECLEDRWIVQGDSNGRGETEIPFEGTPRQRAEKLAKVITDRVDSWGLALMGGYWKPVLVVEVGPDAEWRYRQLTRLLEGSGLEVRRDPPSAGAQ